MNGTRTTQIGGLKERMVKNIKVLILGSKSQLAQQLIQLLLNKNIEFIAASRLEIDITKTEQLREAIKGNEFSHLVNCAALTNVDLCENGEENRIKNYLGPINIVNQCREFSIKLIHISTDYVFSSNTPIFFNENDKKNPINEYGKYKSLAEDYMLENYDYATWIIRTAWLYGSSTNSFPNKIIEKYRKDGGIRIVDDQFGQPTSTVEVAAAIKNIIQDSYNPGVYHIASRDFTSRYEFALEIFKISNLPLKAISRCLTTDFESLAKRPKYSLLSVKSELANESIKDISWRNSLNRYFPRN